MLDLFSGLGGASQAMAAHGWKIISADIDKKFCPSIVCDVLHLPLKPIYFDFIWASPPCTEFSRSSLPWIKSSNEPNTSLVRASKKIIDEFQPKFYCIENVKGAIPWLKPILGNYTFCINPYYFWTNVPHLEKISFSFLPGKTNLTRDPSIRAKIPYVISQLFCSSIENYLF
jgi:hypothetical protein